VIENKAKHMGSQPQPMTPSAMPMHEALNRSDPFKKLMGLVKESQARLSIVQTVLPQALCACVQAGSLNEEGWTLIATNTAVGAKLRQLQPRMEEALRLQGRGDVLIRIKTRI
jgi:hypothetical protein